jgi:uncharacterized membrane protein YoaK (UPF0700 family)
VNTAVLHEASVSDRCSTRAATSTLAVAGRGVAARRRGADRRRALGLVPNLLLWAAMVLGSLCGALAYYWINLAAIWFAAGDSTGAKYDPGGDAPPIALTANAACPI